LARVRKAGDEKRRPQPPGWLRSPQHGKAWCTEIKVLVIVQEQTICIVLSSIRFIAIGTLSIGDTMAFAETLTTYYFERCRW
jgi:hypothetical protein